MLDSAAFLCRNRALDALRHATLAHRLMTTANLSALEHKLFRFLTYIPENSPVSHWVDENGNHHFLNAEGYMERLEFSHYEFWYLAQQHGLLG